LSESINGKFDISTSDKLGVVLLCHGSQRGNSRTECSCAWFNGPDSDKWCRDCPSTAKGLVETCAKLQEILGSGTSEVILSCLEFIEPHPDEAVQMLSERGIRQAIVMPYLLGNGKHATEEMDEVLDELRSKLPHLDIHLTDGLGSDPKLADVVCDRINGMDDFTPREPGDIIGILLVKAGTKSEYDDCIWFAALGELVEKKLGSGYAVEVAQSHYGDPTMQFAVDKLVTERSVDVIVCVPYVFFPGLILQRNIVGSINQLQSSYPDVNMVITPPLGVDDRIVNVAADRIRNVLA
jgi:sirohydrochlorin ferrochelatase